MASSLSLSAVALFSVSPMNAYPSANEERLREKTQWGHHLLCQSRTDPAKCLRARVSSCVSPAREIYAVPCYRYTGRPVRVHLQPVPGDNIIIFVRQRPGAVLSFGTGKASAPLYICSMALHISHELDSHCILYGGLIKIFTHPQGAT